MKKLITSLYFLIIGLFVENEEKARLDRIDDTPLLNKLDDVALQYAHIILPICLIILMILFVLLCYAIIGVSATDSGLQYNHLQEVI